MSKCKHNLMVYESQMLIDSETLVMFYHCSNKKCKRKQKEIYKLRDVKEYDDGYYHKEVAKKK